MNEARAWPTTCAAAGEEEIDLEATHQTLKAIDKDIAKALNTHNGFLKELGLPLVPSA